MQVPVLNNQTLLDVAIRHCGTVEAVAAIAILNNISITQDLVPGQLLELPDKNYGYSEVVNYLAINKKDPATALTEAQKAITEGASGIGFWILENNFTVQ